MLTSEQENAVQEKIHLLQELNKNHDNILQIRDKIYHKRMKWLNENFDRVSKSLANYSNVEQAFRLVFFEYMKIDPASIEAKYLPSQTATRAVYIKSRNFCPYLDTFQILGYRDCRRICRLMLEENVSSMANEFLHRQKLPPIWFSRNYDDLDDGITKTMTGIRPSLDHCQEYFIDRSLSPTQFHNYLRTCETGLEFDYTGYRELWLIRKSLKTED